MVSSNRPRTSETQADSATGSLSRAFRQATGGEPFSAMDAIPQGGLAQKPAPPTEPMPSAVWKKIYVRRNGQMELLFDFTTDKGVFAAKEQLQKQMGVDFHLEDRGTSGIKIQHRDNWGNWANHATLKSWGELVETLVKYKTNLTGLCLGDQQKSYLHKFELQGKDLQNCQLDEVDLQGFDLSKTNFSQGSIRKSNMKDTTGQSPSFSNTKAHLADFSGASYIEPDFSYGQFLRTRHFRSSYELPKFEETIWTDSRNVGTKFLFKHNEQAKGKFGVDFSGTLNAACLFYGMGAETVAARMKFSRSDFPGSCFYNIYLVAKPDRGTRGDFSSLHHDDPRLTEEEKTFVAQRGQWLNSKEGLDGVKVSNDVKVDGIEGQRLYTMFSDIDFGNAAELPAGALFFSKTPVLHREGFHECKLAGIENILPKAMVKTLQATTGAVIAPVVEEKEEPAAAPAAKEPAKKEHPGVKIPELTVDHDEISRQVAALKTAGSAAAMQIGTELQSSFIGGTKLVSEWALSYLGQETSLDREITTLAQDIESYALKLEVEKPQPAPVVVQAPPPPAPAPVKKGWFATLFGDEQDSYMPIPVEVPKVIAPPPPKTVDAFPAFRSRVDGLPEKVTQAMTQNLVMLQSAEDIKKFLGKIKEAFTAYRDEIGKSREEIIKANPDVGRIVNMRQGSIENSLKLVEAMHDKAENLFNVLQDDGAAIQWVQENTLPSLQVHFAKAACVQEVVAALRENGNQPQKLDGKLANYFRGIVNPAAPEEPRQQLLVAFEKARIEVAARLKDVGESLVAKQAERNAAVREILAPA